VSILKPGESVEVGLATAAVVGLIYQSHIPLVATIRGNGVANDGNIEAARKSAAWEAVGVLGLIYLMTRDWNVVLIGGATMAGIDLVAKHHNGSPPVQAATPAGSIVAVPADIQPVPAQAYAPPPDDGGAGEYY
jgi:hypothetical protein